MFRVSLVLLAIVAVGAAQSPRQLTPHQQLIRVIKHDQPGAAVLVRKAGKTVYTVGVGVRSLGAPAPIDERTNFRLASVTKQFTAMAVMLLVREGKLTYETRLTQVFPDFSLGDGITIRNLLNHTSGLPDYEVLMDHADKKWTPEDQISDAEVYELLKNAPRLNFAPGTKWSYSNSGYVMLGLVVGKISGKPFDEFMQQRIFDRLGMRNTLAYIKGKNVVPYRALGHVKEGDSLVQHDQSSTSATLGDGGVYSNLNDLELWDQALRRNTLISAAEMSFALTPVRLKDGSVPHWDSGPGDSDPLNGKPVEYGFGWFLDPYKKHERMWHYGDTSGFQTAIERFPKDDLTVIVLCNRTDIDPKEIALRFADRYLGH